MTQMYAARTSQHESRGTRNGHLDESRGTFHGFQMYASRLSEVRETYLISRKTPNRNTRAGKYVTTSRGER